MYRYDVGTRLTFRPIDEEDGYLVTKWRNSRVARDVYFNQDVVTPDTHINFLANRKKHDLVWMIDLKGTGYSIGMTSLTVNVEAHTAEYGRAFIAPEYTGKGYATEQEYMVLSFAFEVLRLDSLWGDVLETNAAALKLHYETGWYETGIDLLGHTNLRGTVVHIIYLQNYWQKQRQIFIDKFGADLPEELE